MCPVIGIILVNEDFFVILSSVFHMYFLATL